MRPVQRSGLARRLFASAAPALLGLACSQSALLGVAAREVAISAAAGGTVVPGDGAPSALAGFKLVLHPGDLPGDTTITLQLGPASEDLSSAGPAVLLGPLGLQLNRPAELTLPYALGPGQSDADLFVELEDGSGLPKRLDHQILNIDLTAHVIRCLLPRLGEVHALAPRHCMGDPDCGGAGFCHDAVCRPRYLPDGGMDPEADGGPRHP